MGQVCQVALGLSPQTLAYAFNLAAVPAKFRGNLRVTEQPLKRCKLMQQIVIRGPQSFKHQISSRIAETSTCWCLSTMRRRRSGRRGVLADLPASGPKEEAAKRRCLRASARRENCPGPAWQPGTRQQALSGAGQSPGSLGTTPLGPVLRAR